MGAYDRNIEEWNKRFAKNKGDRAIQKSIDQEDLAAALDWLCQDSHSILDFGCGAGVWLFKCFLRGTVKHLGIDNSREAIRVAREYQETMEREGFTFIVGGIGALETIAAESYDGAILSNIIDNLIPADAVKVLAEMKRILTPQGKIVLKLNKFLSPEQIEKRNIRIVEGNFLDDGLFLWNQSTAEWTELLRTYFTIADYKKVHYGPESHDRLFLLSNDKKTE